MRGREKEREQRERALEKKARQQADQCGYLNTSGMLATCSHLSFFNVSLFCIASLDTFEICGYIMCFLPVVALEEQRANLNRELSTLRHAHNKVRHGYFV